MIKIESDANSFIFGSSCGLPHVVNVYAAAACLFRCDFDYNVNAIVE